MHAAAYTGAGLAEGPVCEFAALPDTGSTAHRPRRGNYPAYMLLTLQHHDASRAPRAHIISTDGSERRPGPASAPFLGLRSRTSDSCMPWRAMCGRQAITPFTACTAQHGHEENLGLPCSHVTLSRPNNGGCVPLVKSDSVALANMLCMRLGCACTRLLPRHRDLSIASSSLGHRPTHICTAPALIPRRHSKLPAHDISPPCVPAALPLIVRCCNACMRSCSPASAEGGAQAPDVGGSLAPDSAFHCS